MKKVLFFAFSILLMFVLIGCGSNKTESVTTTGGPVLTFAPRTTKTKSPAVTTVTTSPANITTITTEKQPIEIEDGYDYKGTKKVKIYYCNWNIASEELAETDMERLMINEFMKQYPNITVEVVAKPASEEGTWNEWLTMRASIGSLPDVIMPDNIPLYIENGWISDVTEYTEKDSEYANLAAAVKGATTYNGHVLALPLAVHYYGYVVNKTLFESRNVKAPNTSTTMEDFIEKIQDAANHSAKDGSGVAGLSGIEHILHWYPANLNPNLQWWAFDGTEFKLNSDEYKATVAKYLELRRATDICVDFLEGDREEIFGTFDLANSGKLLAYYAGSYTFAGMQKNINDGTYNWSLDFIGTPVINGNKVNPTSMDFICVSSTTKHPEEAYLLARWMGFSNLGYLKRLELSKSVEGITAVNFPPLQNNEVLLNKYFELYPSFTGLRTIIESGSFVMENQKNLPGYNVARYTGTYDSEHNMFQMLADVMDGTVDYADICVQYNEKANSLFNSYYNDTFLPALNKLIGE